MNIKRRMSSAIVCLVAGLCVPMVAQTGHIGAKETTPTQDAAGASELDHMSLSLARLKLEAAKIQDPAAKKAAMENVELWQHLLDKMMRDNPKANNTGAEHHHDNAPAAPELKQSPKPQ